MDVDRNYAAVRITLSLKIMSLQVWLRFEKKKTDGTVLKLRIQDLPSDRIEEATDLMAKYFLRDEPIRKACGFLKNPNAIEEYKEYIIKTCCDPASRNVMCCEDNDDETPAIMGISLISVASAAYWDLSANKATEESIKIQALFGEVVETFDLLKELNLTTYYADKSMLVVPEYRGYGIAEKFFTVRRLMCAAHNIPVTGAWLTNMATQIAAERDGWETVCDIDYKEILQRHGLPVLDVPPTIKLVVGRPHPEYSPTA